GLNANPSSPTCLPTTVSKTLEIFCITRSQNSWFTSRAAVRIFSETPEPAARLASESISDSAKLPPSDPGCRQRGAMRLSSPSANARSTASALTCSHKLDSSLMKETLVAKKAVEASRTSSAVSKLVTITGTPRITSGRYNDFNADTACVELVPSTMRSGQLKSSTAQPSDKKIGWETTTACLPAVRNRPSMRRAVPTGIGVTSTTI